MCDLFENRLVPLFGIVVGKLHLRGVAVETAEVIPSMFGGVLFPVLINRLESVKQC